MRTTSGVLVLMGVVAIAPARAAIVGEVYADRAAFEARLGGSPGVVDFDDVTTSGSTPVSFAADRYAAQGIIITGQGGQYVSRDFSFPTDFQPTSSPNLYAPGPTSTSSGGGHDTDVTFRASGVPGLVAGFGAVFVDADFPDLGPSSLVAFDAGDTLLESVPVSGANGSQLFRGVVTVDDTTDTPTPAIKRVHLINGNEWPPVDNSEGVALDDFVFGPPVPGVAPGACGSVPRTDCRHPTAAKGASLTIVDKAADGKDKLVWLWGKGAATAVADFGTPTDATDMTLCLWDGGILKLAAAAPAGGTCAGKACWKSTKAGFKYRDRDLTPSGVLTVLLRAGGAGKAKAVVKAKGTNLAPPVPPLATPIVVQLVAEGGGCWDATFSAAKKNGGGLLKARSD